MASWKVGSRCARSLAGHSHPLIPFPTMLISSPLGVCPIAKIPASYKPTRAGSGRDAREGGPRQPLVDKPTELHSKLGREITKHRAACMANRSHNLAGGETQSKDTAAAPGVVEGARALVATGSMPAEPGHCKELRRRTRAGTGFTWLTVSSPPARRVVRMAIFAAGRSGKPKGRRLNDVGPWLAPTATPSLPPRELTGGVGRASASGDKTTVEMLSAIRAAESKLDNTRARKGNAASYCVHSHHPCGPNPRPRHRASDVSVWLLYEPSSRVVA